MKKILLSLILQAALIFSGFNRVCGQEGNVPLESQVKRGAANRSAEKIYLHLDRPTYLVGESIWFRILVTDENLHPSDLSHIAYIEFLGQDRQSSIQEKIEVKNGKGNGAISIPADLPSGYYQVRCYTNWMKNFGHSFETVVCILNSFLPGEATASKGETPPELRFFPEGGRAPGGIPHKYGFLAQQSDGTGIAFEGRILDETGVFVANFSPLQNGIGSFIFQPEPGKTYSAEIRLRDGRTMKYPFLEVPSDGFAMRLTDDPSQLSVSVAVRKRQDKKLFLLLYQGEKSAAFESGISGETASFRIPKTRLKPGVNVLVLLDESMKPVAERLYFNDFKPASILTKTGSPQIQKRGNISLALESTGTNDTLEASVAVYLSDSLPEPAQPSVTAALLLTSELSGYVENPDQYLDPGQTRLSEIRDNLMLTHGWRRFKPEEILQENFNAAYLPEMDGHLIFGSIHSRVDGKPLSERAIFAAFPSGSVSPWVGTSDSRGRFMLESRNFYGPKELVVQTNSSLDTTGQISVDSPFLGAGNSALPTMNAPIPANSDLLKRSINMQTQNSYFPNKRQVSAPDSSTFYGQPDYRYYLDDYTRFPTVEEVFREYVPSVNVRIRNGKFYSRIVETGVHKQYFTEDPLILLDGIPMFESDPLFRMDPLKIKKADVVNRTYYLGPLAFPGIISCHTYSNDLSGFEIDPKALVIAYKGVLENREFSHPDYSNPAQNSLRKPDFRNILYWNPSVKIIPGSPLNLNFFASDQSGRYKIVVQALSDRGTTGTGASEFQIID